MYVFLLFLSRARQTDDGLLLHAHIYPSKKKEGETKTNYQKKKRNITKKERERKDKPTLLHIMTYVIDDVLLTCSYLNEDKMSFDY